MLSGRRRLADRSAGRTSSPDFLRTICGLYLRSSSDSDEAIAELSAERDTVGSVAERLWPRGAISDSALVLKLVFMADRRGAARMSATEEEAVFSGEPEEPW